jgi:hypothetical protein
MLFQSSLELDCIISQFNCRYVPAVLGQAEQLKYNVESRMLCHQRGHNSCVEQVHAHLRGRLQIFLFTVAPRL